MDMLIEDCLDAVEQRVPLREEVAVGGVTVVVVELGVAEDVDALIEGVIKIARSFQYALAGIPDAELGEFLAVVSVDRAVRHRGRLEIKTASKS